MKKKERDLIAERMRKLAEVDVNAESDSNVIEFKPREATGGKEPPSGFWLKDLEVATVFLARPKSNPGVGLAEYGLINKIGVAALLLENQPNQSLPIWVDMRRFSNQMENIQTIRENDPRIKEIWEQYTALMTKPTSEQ